MSASQSEASPTLGVIVNTHNAADYLGRVLRALAAQTSRPNEILLAEDGTDGETRDCFTAWQQQCGIPARHLWQEHAGYRRSRILNLAVAAAHADYLVFLDGDTVPHPQFIADHRALAQPGRFVQGHRALIQQRAASWFGRGEFRADRRRALLQFQIRGLKHAFRWLRPWCRVRHDLRGVRGCNFAVWRTDLLRVNGFNEAFVGWGREDSELACRLLNAGVQRMDVRGWALCYHLWHPLLPRDRLATNDELLQHTIQKRLVRCDNGLDKHRPETAPKL